MALKFKTRIPITIAHLTNTKNRPRHKIVKFKKIAIHYTGNGNKGANAMANRNYFNNTSTLASAQYCVDDKQIVECMPYWEVAWAVGAKSYTKFGNSLMVDGKSPNYSTISIEMCINKDSDYFEVVQNTVSLVVWLLLETGLTLNDVCRHFDITGKQCPYFYLDDLDWNNFLQCVKDVYEDVKENRTPQIDYNSIFNIEILADTLNVRRGPTVNYEVVTKYTKGQEVIVYESVEGWYRSKDGWFSGDKTYCRIIEELDIDSEPSLELDNAFGIVTADILNIRSAPNTSATVVGKYFENDQVKLLEDRAEWYRTDKGWIYSEYVRRIDYRENVEFLHDVTIIDENSNPIYTIPKDKLALMFTEEKYIKGRVHRKIKYNEYIGYINPYVYRDIK